MQEYQEIPLGTINHRGQPVPVVAFYSVQGGVGKTTLARKFAELVTKAPGRDGYKPNVLLIDLDVEAMGLTYRLGQRVHQIKTVHEVMAQRNTAAAEALNVTGAVSLSSGDAQDASRGLLYLIPAAPPGAKAIFDTLANIPKNDLLKLLRDMITELVRKYDISCVVIDCAPGANPYTAAAATLSDIPLLIGRNEDATYKQIWVLPDRFREWYDQFQPAKQRVIINAVAAKDLFEAKAKQYDILDYIPLTTDVILETEGLPNKGSMRMLLFEKYVVDLIKKVFAGMKHLIPEAPKVLGPEWAETLQRLCCLEYSPKLRRLRPLRYLLWVGAALVLIGLVLIGAHQVFNTLPAALPTFGVACAIVGVILAAVGWYAESERRRILLAAQNLVLGGPDEVFRKLGAGASKRKELEEMRKLAATVPIEVMQQQAIASRGAKSAKE